MRSHRAGLILAFGILGLVGFFPCAPIAWLMGHTDLNKMREGTMDPAGEHLTNLGRFLGMVVTMLMLTFLCGAIAANSFLTFR